MVGRGRALSASIIRSPNPRVHLDCVSACTLNLERPARLVFFLGGEGEPLVEPPEAQAGGRPGPGAHAAPPFARGRVNGQ